MRSVRDVAIIAALMALGTWFLSWWAVPVIAVAAAVVDRSRKMGLAKPTIAAPIAWGVLLLIQGLFGSSIMQLGRDVGVSLDLPPLAPLVLALCLPALLALFAAGTVVAIRSFRAQTVPASTLPAAPPPAPQ